MLCQQMQSQIDREREKDSESKVKMNEKNIETRETYYRRNVFGSVCVERTSEHQYYSIKLRLHVRPFPPIVHHRLALERVKTLALFSN